MKLRWMILTTITLSGAVAMSAQRQPNQLQRQSDDPPSYKVIDLGTLGGLDSGAYVINKHDQIVGFASAFDDDNGPHYHATLWNDGSATDLGTLNGGICSEALDINDRGQVVGSSGPSDVCALRRNQRAFLWENGTMVDLNDLIPPNSNIELQFANTINECGEINGNGVLSTGDPRAFVLIPEGCPGGKGPDILELTSSSLKAPAMPAAQSRNRGARVPTRRVEKLAGGPN